jgi:hypothetical protein
VPGLVWRDTLSLSWPQWALVTAISCGSLWMTTRRRSVWVDLTWTVAALLLLVVAFWQHQIGIDVATTWNTLPTLSNTGWWSEFSTANYLKLQPPLWTWWLVTFPSYGWQQAYALGIGYLIYAVFVRKRGQNQALWLLACPLFQLMTVQPSNDWMVAGLLCFAVYSRRRWVLSAFCICCAVSLKYTAYAILPLFIWILPIPTLCACGWIMSYWFVAFRLNAFWPREQARYVMFSFSLGWIPLSLQKVTLKASSAPSMRFLGTSLWRIRHLTIPSLCGAWWYLFPWYCQRLSILTIIGISAILIGFGNIKYLSLMIPLFLLTKRNCENFS